VEAQGGASHASSLWQQEGTRTEVHPRLAPSDAWGMEGCDTADVQEPTTLMEALVG